MHAASPPNPNHAIRFQPCSTQSLQRDDNREHNAQISSSSSSRRRRCHQPCSRHAYAPSFAGRTASAPLCTQRLPLPTPLDPSFERLAPPPLSAGCAQSKMSSCECGLFNLACGPPPRPGPTTFGVLCYQNEYCDWCTSLRVHFPNCTVCASPLFPLGHLFDFSAGISLCTFSGAALATPIVRAILPLRTMR